MHDTHVPPESWNAGEENHIQITGAVSHSILCANDSQIDGFLPTEIVCHCLGDLFFSSLEFVWISLVGREHVIFPFKNEQGAYT